MPPDPSPAAAIVDQVRAALESPDPSRLRALLHPDVRWGAPDDASPSCQNRDQVLAWYQRGHEAGVRAHVTAADAHGDRILVAMRVTGARGAERLARAVDRWQVLTVRDGRIADIRGFDRRADAEALASASDPR